MLLSSGLFDHMVLQRTRRNVCDVRITGTAAATGVVRATVKRRGARLSGLSAKAIGKASDGVLTARLAGLPAGGPFEVALSVTGRSGKVLDRLVVKDVLVGDVWILAGQSNMEGIGWIKHRLAARPLVRAFYMDDHWAVAQDPLHVLGDAVDPVHTTLNGGVKPERAAHVGVGPGVAFGQELLRLTRVPQGLLCCAHGGTSMGQWDPGLRNKGGESLYGALLRRVRRNGDAVAGMFWYQGCSDADEASAPLYTQRMQALVAALRSDLRSGSLPVVMVQIAGVCGDGWNERHWHSVQEQQRLLPRSIRRLSVVPAIDLALDDLIHLAGSEQHRLGRRAAGAMAALAVSSRAARPPLELAGVTIRTDPQSGMANVSVRYRNVAGKLVAAGKPSGFCLTRNQHTKQGDWIYRVDLAADTAVLRTVLPKPEAEGMFLHYGLGLMPHCTITDQADRSLPVMGPLYLGGSRVYSPYVNRFEVSSFQPSAGKLHDLAYPTDKAALGFAPRTFIDMNGSFCSLHPEIAASSIPDLLVYYRLAVACAEDMACELHLGYDGPTKMWVDGRQVFFDPEGVNPALPEDSVTPVRLTKGEHEILIALGSNNLKAWGIFLRLARTDVPLEMIIKGPGAYSVPVVVGWYRGPQVRWQSPVRTRPAKGQSA